METRSLCREWYSLSNTLMNVKEKEDYVQFIFSKNLVVLSQDHPLKELSGSILPELRSQQLHLRKKELHFKSTLSRTFKELRHHLRKQMGIKVSYPFQVNSISNGHHDHDLERNQSQVIQDTYLSISSH